MPGNEAMRLFVKTLEEDEPDWYSYPTAADGTPADDDGAADGNPGLRNMPPDDCWRTPCVAGEKHPHPRFEHSSCLIGSTMYVFGGNTGAPRAPQYLVSAVQVHMCICKHGKVTPLGVTVDCRGSYAPHVPRHTRLCTHFPVPQF